MHTLYLSQTSPFARKVRVALHETGLHAQVEEISVDPFANPESLIEANPLGRIPTLVVDDASHVGSSPAQVLTESSLIVDYINQQSGSHLLPKQDDWEQKAHAAICEGVMNDSFAIVLEKRRPSNEQSPAFIERRYVAIQRALGTIAAYPLTNSSVLSLRDISVAVALAYLDFRLPETQWRDHCPNHITWFDEVSERSSMQLTQPPST